MLFLFECPCSMFMSFKLSTRLISFANSIAWKSSSCHTHLLRDVGENNFWLDIFAIWTMVYCQIRLAVLDIFRLSIIKLSIFISSQRCWLVHLQGHLLGHEDNYSWCYCFLIERSPPWFIWLIAGWCFCGSILWVDLAGVSCFLNDGVISRFFLIGDEESRLWSEPSHSFRFA